MKTYELTSHEVRLLVCALSRSIEDFVIFHDYYASSIDITSVDNFQKTINELQSLHDRFLLDLKDDD